VTERAVLRLVDEDAVDSAPEVRGARWRLDLAALDRQRVVRGWTRAELARRAHVAPATLSCMFRGHRRPVFASVQALCVALGLELQDVIVFEDEGTVGESWRRDRGPCSSVALGRRTVVPGVPALVGHTAPTPDLRWVKSL
jgi:transcriptional regulator with XRE-family HTH domain